MAYILLLYVPQQTELSLAEMMGLPFCTIFCASRSAYGAIFSYLPCSELELLTYVKKGLNARRVLSRL